MRITALAALLALAACAGFSYCYAAGVGEAEAVAVADMWLSGELNANRAKLNAKEIGARLAAVQNRQVLYLVSATELLDHAPDKGMVLAYVVKYQPIGYAIVSAEDRIQPIIAFDVASQFQWDQPAATFMHEYLGTTMAARWANLNRQVAANGAPDVHPNWALLRAKLQGGRNTDDLTTSGTYYVMWDTAVWGQGNYYNDVCVSHNGGTDVPTGCTATAMATLMRFFEWPISGSGSHSYSDNEELVKYNHSANFAHTYN